MTAEEKVYGSAYGEMQDTFHVIGRTGYANLKVT